MLKELLKLNSFNPNPNYKLKQEQVLWEESTIDFEKDA